VLDFNELLKAIEVEETTEEAAKIDAKAHAKAMLLAGKWSVEDIVAETALDRLVVLGIKGALARYGRLPSQAEEGEEGEGRGYEDPYERAVHPSSLGDP